MPIKNGARKLTGLAIPSREYEAAAIAFLIWAGSSDMKSFQGNIGLVLQPKRTWKTNLTIN